MRDLSLTKHRPRQPGTLYRVYRARPPFPWRGDHFDAFLSLGSWAADRELFPPSMCDYVNVGAATRREALRVGKRLLRQRQREGVAESHAAERGFVSVRFTSMNGPAEVSDDAFDGPGPMRTASARATRTRGT